MRKISALLATTLLISVLAIPAPAFAAGSVKVSARTQTVTRANRPAKIVFKTRMSRPAKVKVTIYRHGKKVRTIKTSGTWYRKTVTWNLRDAQGRKVAPGSYTYKVTAVRRGSAAVKRGTVRIKRPPAPTPAPAPSSGATAAPDPAVPSTGTAPAPDPSPAPAPVPSPASDRLMGYWVPGAPSDMAPLEALEAQLGHRAGVVNFFIADTESFPASRCQNIVDHGAVPLVTLEFWSTSNGGVESITAGSKDAYLRAFADRAREFGDEIWLRPLHEMNGNWYPWGGSASGNTPAEVIAAWRHVHDIFESRGATNVKMVWCVNNDSVPYTTANGIAKYWPGDAYVDYTSIDGYNAGTTQSWSTWRSFSATFRNAYNTVTGLSAKPVVIAETSSVEQGGSKSAWIRDMFTSLETEFPRVRGVVWFNERKTYDWRIESASANIAVFKTGLTAF